MSKLLPLARSAWVSLPRGKAERNAHRQRPGNTSPLRKNRPHQMSHSRERFLPNGVETTPRVRRYSRLPEIWAYRPFCLHVWNESEMRRAIEFDTFARRPNDRCVFSRHLRMSRSLQPVAPFTLGKMVKVREFPTEALSQLKHQESPLVTANLFPGGNLLSQSRSQLLQIGCVFQRLTSNMCQSQSLQNEANRYIFDQRALGSGMCGPFGIRFHLPGHSGPTREHKSVWDKNSCCSESWTPSSRNDSSMTSNGRSFDVSIRLISLGNSRSQPSTGRLLR